MDISHVPLAPNIAPQAPNIPPLVRKAGPLTRLLLAIAGIDEELLQRCPPRDWGIAKGIGAIGLCVGIYLTSLFFLMANKLFSPPGQIRIELLVPSLFFAIFIIVIDAFQINRTSWNLSGIAALKRGGLDISGGFAARIKATSFLPIRLILSGVLAQLTAIFASLLIYGGDISAPIEKKYLEVNGHLIAPATALVDAEIQRAADSMTAQIARVATLSRQVEALRNAEIDPSANDPRVQQAQQELQRLIEQKAKADEDVRSAETSVSNELGGFKGAAPGRGPRYRAAVEQLTNAKARAQETTKQVEAARERLDALRRNAPPPDDSKRQRLHDQRLAFEKALDAENAELSKQKDELSKLTHGRENAIRRAIESAPDHVAAENGFLAQLSELELIAQKDRWIAFIIGLIDLASFGLEFSAVLAKVTSYVPTTYAALLARDAYMQAVRTVDDMMAELKAVESPEQKQSEILAPETAPDDKHDSGSASGPNPFGNSHDAPPQPAKRKRGRPRKYPRPGEQLEMPVGEKMKNGHEGDQGQ